MRDLNFPETWTLAKLGEVTTIVGGGTPSRDEKSFFDGEIPWATPTDVTSLADLWIDTTAESITKEGLLNSSAKLLPAGTVLMTSRATIGVTAIARQPMTTNQGFANFICKDHVLNNEYLTYWLPYIRDWLIQLAGGTTFKEISKSTLTNVQIPLPPLPEQRRIVAILQQSDKLCQMRQLAGQKIKHLYRALFYQYFGTGHTSSGNYSTIKLKELLKVPLTSGFSPSETRGKPPGIPVFILNAVTDFGLTETEVKYYPIDSYQGRGYDLEQDDILITRSNTQELVGKAARYQGRPFPVIYPDLMIRIRLKDPKDSPYVENFLRSDAAVAVIRRAARGTSGSMKKISQGDLSEFDILWPPEKDRQAYIKQLKLLEQQKERLEASRMKVETLFQSLLTQAFTGELTAAWREKHPEVSEEAQIFSDLFAKEEQEAVSTVDYAFTEELAAMSKAVFARSVPRSEVTTTLSIEQYNLLEVIYDLKGYFTMSMVQSNSSMSPHVVREGLQLFTSLGLIQEIRLPDRPMRNIVMYVPAYRHINEQDRAKERDLELLEKASRAAIQGFDPLEKEIFP